MTKIDWYRIAGEAWAKIDAQYLGDEEPEPLAAEAAALGPGLRAAVDAVLAITRPEDWRAGYDAAVEELRGVVRRSGSPSAEWAAGYLAVQRKYVERRVLDFPGEVEAPLLVEGGHVWSPYGDIQQCVNCHLTRAAYFHTGARRSCPRRPSAGTVEDAPSEFSSNASGSSCPLCSRPRSEHPQRTYAGAGVCLVDQLNWDRALALAAERGAAEGDVPTDEHLDDVLTGEYDDDYPDDAVLEPLSAQLPEERSDEGPKNEEPDHDDLAPFDDDFGDQP